MFAGTVLLPNKMSNVQLSYLNSDAIVKYTTAKKQKKQGLYTQMTHEDSDKAFNIFSTSADHMCSYILRQN